MMEKYNLKDGKITKNGHTMFIEDIVKELNCWNNYKKKRARIEKINLECARKTVPR